MTDRVSAHRCHALIDFINKTYLIRYRYMSMALSNLVIYYAPQGKFNILFILIIRNVETSNIINGAVGGDVAY